MSNQLEEFVLDDGTVVKLGNVAPPDGLMSADWELYGSVPNTPLVARDEWKDRVDAMGVDPEVGWPLPYVHNQTNIGMCNASDTCSLMESLRAKQGLKPVKLSGGDLYRRICFNGRDSGSLLEDAIREAMKVGVASVDTCPYLDWKNDHQGAAAERPRYRLLETFLCPTYDHVMSALLSGFDVSVGVMWYDSYRPTAASAYWLPAPGGNAGGHAIHSFKPTYRKVGNSIEYGTWCKNSWTASFGDRGRFVIPERGYGNNKIGGFWAGRSIVDEGGVIPEEK